MGTETEETTEQAPKYPVVKYDLTEAKVAELREAYADLEIKGVDDKGGLALAHAGRMEIKGIRVGIEKLRKQFNAGALEFTRTVNAKAKEATAPLLPLEAHLKAEEDRIAAEKKRIKEEAEREKQEKLQARVDALRRVGCEVTIVNVMAMSDDDFRAAYAEAKEEQETEEARLAKEEEDRKALEESERVEREAKEEEDRLAREAEEARLAKQREEQERVAAEQEEKAEEIKAEEERVEAERKALENDKLIEAAKKEAEERGRQEEKDRVAREAAEAEERDRKAKAEAARQEALKPDKEKLLAYANALDDRPIATPSVKDKKAEAIMIEALDKIRNVADFIRREVEKM